MAFAVIDFETTGLVPERGDRVIEIGIVLVNEAGSIEREWTTLVNPHRDIGASHIHGLCAADLLDAPEFQALADQLLEFVRGRTVVAHNATFDMRFLYAELIRAGYLVSAQPPALCSMKWSGRLVGPAKLQHACSALGVPLSNAHSALADARATAGLLTHLLRASRNEKQRWDEDICRSREFAWPKPLGRPPSRAIARSETHVDSSAWLNIVLNCAWVPGVPDNEASYLLVLERSLLDRQISRSEGDQLVAAAKSAGLSGLSVARLHRDYLRSIAQEALADGILTAAEKADLVAIGEALCLTDEDVTEALAWASAKRPTAETRNSFALTAGDRIVFTGETSRPREEWVAAIVEAGLASGGVTKSTKLVAAADADSQSGKASKARAYGIPIVNEETFTRLFEIYRANR